MNQLKTFKILLCLALVLMLVFGIIIIVDYTSTGRPALWSGLGAMLLTAIVAFLKVRDFKKKELN